MIEGKKICITGGAGFIGSALAGRLVGSNEIVVLDSFARNSLEQKEYSQHPNITAIRGDVMDYEVVSDAVREADYIIHCAGVAGIRTVCQKPTHTMEVNILGSVNVLKAAAENPKCKRVVCFSTSEVFGSCALTSKESDQTVIGAAGQARWTYAVSKLAEEHLAFAYFRERKVPACIVRPFNIYGPGQVGEGALKIFVQQALANTRVMARRFGHGVMSMIWWKGHCVVSKMMLQ